MPTQQKIEQEKNDGGNGTSRPPEDELVVTKHTATILGQTVHYTATAGRIVLREETEKKEKSAGEKARASIFFSPIPGMTSRIRKTGRSPSPSTVALDPLQSGCTSAYWVPAGFISTMKVVRRHRPIAW